MWRWQGWLPWSVTGWNLSAIVTWVLWDITPELSETPRSNLLNQPEISICPIQATWLMENHSLHHITSGPVIPSLPSHTWLKLHTLTQANKMQSVQEFNWLLELFIQQLEVKMMDSSYKDSQPHSVQGYWPHHHGSVSIQLKFYTKYESCTQRTISYSVGYTVVWDHDLFT